MSVEERRIIFINIEDLLLTSELFIADLRCRQSSQSGILTNISDIFTEHVKNFDPFRQYCMGHQEASKLLNKKLESGGAFSKFINEAMNYPRCCSLDLATFLLEPVQRLARYPLLLKQVFELVLLYLCLDFALH